MARIVELPDGSVELHDIWGVEDVQSVQDLRDEPALTLEQCNEVLRLLAETFDPNYGITWEHVEQGIDYVLSRERRRQAKPRATEDNVIDVLASMNIPYAVLDNSGITVRKIIDHVLACQVSSDPEAIEANIRTFIKE